MLLDRTWTDLTIPILAWAIETDEGVIVVDTGETGPYRTSRGTSHAERPYYQLAVRSRCRSPNEEIGPQLLKLGIRPWDVQDGDPDASAHRPCGRPASLPEERDPRACRGADGLGEAGWSAGSKQLTSPSRWPEWFAPRVVAFPEARHRLAPSIAVASESQRTAVS